MTLKLSYWLLALVCSTFHALCQIRNLYVELWCISHVSYLNLVYFITYIESFRGVQKSDEMKKEWARLKESMFQSWYFHSDQEDNWVIHNFVCHNQIVFHQVGEIHTCSIRLSYYPTSNPSYLFSTGLGYSTCLRFFHAIKCSCLFDTFFFSM